jgi:hypothetical protein
VFSARAGTGFRLFHPSHDCAIVCVIFGALLWVAPPNAVAAPVPDTLELPETKTTGRRSAPQEDAVYRLDAAALRRFATLEEALDALPGFRVRRQGGLGGYSELSFRGARAAQVDVYVDGIRLNQDGDASPDLSSWPLLWFSSLEARSGAEAPGGGPGALARIDLSTRDESRANVQMRAGSFATAEASASARAPVGAGWTLEAGLQGQTARNDHPFLSDNGTTYNPDDDGVWRMDNNAFRSRGVRTALRRERSGSRQSASLLWLDRRKEYPGLFPSSAQAYGTRREWLGAWRLERFAGDLPWETGIQARHVEDAYRDPGQSLGYLSYESARVSTAVEGEAGARMRPAPQFGARADVGLRAEETKPRVTAHSEGRASPDAARGEAQTGLAFDVDLSPFARGLSAHAEGRQAFIRFRAKRIRGYADTADSEDGYSASSNHHPVALRAALQWSLPSQSLSVQVRLEQRAPTSGELLGDNLGILSKLDLRPEETRALSLVHSVGLSSALNVQSTLYANTYRDPVRLKAHGASAFMRYENDADYRSVGFESRMALDAARAEGSVSVNLQEASILEGPYKGRQPVYQSPLESHAECFFKSTAGAATRARAGVLADFRSAYFPGDANVPDSRRPAEWEFGAHGDAQFGAGSNVVRLAVEARNLTNRHYRDFLYSPRSGRSYALFASFSL